MFRRVIVIVLDACGVGELPDADHYGDRGASTITHVAEALGGLKMPVCQHIGLGNIVTIKGVAPDKKAAGAWGKMAEKSPGKDSTSGHWEIGGIILAQPFPLYPNGFPPELIREFESKAGIRTIGNLPASGTEIIKELGERHIKTGEIILYTSADSVFQLAAHEEIVPLERLYEICHFARELLKGEHAVGRVIARPFIGEPGNFIRTAHRKDFSLEPPSKTFLDLMKEKGIPTVAVGKIDDLFARRGISKAVNAKSNMEVMERIMGELTVTQTGLIFANLVDFDMLWGHRNDTESFGRGLEEFDRALADLIKIVSEDDLLVITADHGCDPTLKYSTDHTREYVPLLAYNIRMKIGISLGTRESFADVAATMNDIFSLGYEFPGKSFFKGIVQTLG
ncbi:phosphopentomutase [Candidatus Zixiibacteriota bacterium]|nr:phosphopentomutase [candidate division Zixibacteria bacterium]